MQPIKAPSAEQVTDCGLEYGRKLQHPCPVIWAPAAPGGGLPHGQRERGGGLPLPGARAPAVLTCQVPSAALNGLRCSKNFF